MASQKIAMIGLVAGAVLILDQATKALVLNHLPLGGSIPVIPGFFDLTHVHNPGGAFGFLSGMSAEFRGLLFVAVSFLAVGLILYFYWQTPVRQRLLAVGLSLIFGGAVGNLVDRIRFGIVVDFLDLYAGELHWPAFNVADSAITVGVLIFGYHILFHKDRTDS
ncbi:MAG TPA: signal peptidase II [Desulfobacterales bacterium]|nr:signal peptidase II [Desulfobacterales bacterium]